MNLWYALSCSTVIIMPTYTMNYTQNMQNMLKKTPYISTQTFFRALPFLLLPSVAAQSNSTNGTMPSSLYEYFLDYYPLAAIAAVSGCGCMAYCCLGSFRKKVNARTEASATYSATDSVPLRNTGTHYGAV